MGDYVWVSSIYKSGTLNRRWEIDLFHDGNNYDGSLLFANESGEPISSKHRPQKIWANDKDPPIKKLPPVFNVEYAILVSEKAGKVFEGFDLGRGGLCPMDKGIFQADQTTPYATKYSSWVIGNKKSAVQLDRSQAKMQLNPLGNVWHLTQDDMLADDMVAVSRDALDGPDQWVDPLLQGSLFLSQKLGDAIMDAGLKKAFFLHRCLVV